MILPLYFFREIVYYGACMLKFWSASTAQMVACHLTHLRFHRWYPPSLEAVGLQHREVSRWTIGSWSYGVSPVSL